MKNLKKTRGWLVMAAALTLGLSACSSSEDSIIGQPENPTEKTYTLTVTANKGEDNALARAIAAAGGDGETRALSLSSDGKSITATWKAGEAVTVYNETKYTDLGGTLTAQTDGATTTLTGTLTGKVAPGDVLTLKFLSPNYNAQDGTLTGTDASIDKTCDYATATVTVATATDGKITTTDDADFQNRQAIIKFTLTNKIFSATPRPTALTVAYGASEVTLTDIPDATYTANGDGVVFVAVPTDGKTAQTVTLTATVGGATYAYTRSGVTFEDGQYYAIGVKMIRQNTVNLSDLTGIYTAQNGDVLTGTLSGGYQVRIYSGATVSLKDATILGGNDDDKPWAGITCLGDATIILSGTNSVKGYNHYYPGIQAGGSGTTLTIQGDGKLTATNGGGSDGWSAGIGGGLDQKVGNIVIAGGDITAEGFNGAGIGCGFASSTGNGASCGNITISGGNVTAIGSGTGAGIGSSQGGNGHKSICGDITITGGTVTATGYNRGAGIGSGSTGHCGNITISGGTVTATSDGEGAGIGNGHQGTCGNITISGGTVTATGGSFYYSNFGYAYGAGIGCGNQGSCGNITITAPATGTATGGTGSTYDIGAGRNGTVGTISVAPGTISGRCVGRNLATATAETVGMLIGADGWIYSNVSEATAAGTTAVAMICYVGDKGSVDAGSSTYRALAVALSDANSGSATTWCGQNAETCLSANYASWETAKSDMNGIAATNALASHDNHTHSAATAAKANNGTAAPSGTSGWFLPTTGQWSKMMVGLFGGDGIDYNADLSKYYASHVNSKLTAAGLGSSALLQNDKDRYYWLSTEASWSYGYAIYTYRGYATNKSKTGNNYVRAVLAF